MGSCHLDSLHLAFSSDGAGARWLSFNVASGVFQDECHNFIKVLVPRNDDLVFICGTNGFNPMCRYYRVSGATVTNALHCNGAFSFISP